MPQDRVAVGNGGQKIIVPTVGVERCGSCKFQRQLGGPFGDTHMCLRYPPSITPMADTIEMLPPGTVLNAPQGALPVPQGGMRTIHVRNEVRYPPAPDDWWCGEWKPRFAGPSGERIS